MLCIADSQDLFNSLTEFSLVDKISTAIWCNTVGVMYNAKLLDHFQNPRNVGDLDDADIQVKVCNPVCGDILELTVKIEDGHIGKVCYRARGCTASIAVGSALTEMLAGYKIEQLGSLNRKQIEDAVGGLSRESKHAAVLAVDAVNSLQDKLSPQGGLGQSLCFCCMVAAVVRALGLLS